MIARVDVRFLSTLAGSEKKQAGFPSRCLRREMTTCEIKVIQTQYQKGYILYQEHPVMQTLSWQFALFICRRDLYIFYCRREGGFLGSGWGWSKWHYQSCLNLPVIPIFPCVPLQHPYLLPPHWEPVMHLSVDWALSYLEAFSLAQSHLSPTSETILDIPW